MSSNSGIIKKLFGGPIDGRMKEKSALEELVGHYPRQALAVAERASKWAEELGDLSPVQEDQLQELAMARLMESALTSELLKRGLTDDQGHPSELLSPLRQWAAEGNKLAKELGLSAPSATSSGAINVDDAFKKAWGIVPVAKAEEPPKDRERGYGLPTLPPEYEQASTEHSAGATRAPVETSAPAEGLPPYPETIQEVKPCQK